MDKVRTYLLQQTSQSTQSLTPLSPSASPSYSVATRATAGFMNRKPHMVIQRQEEGLDYICAEVRYEIYGTGTSIAYSRTGMSQDLTLESSSDQRYGCLIGGRSYSWQATGVARLVLELTDSTGKQTASFVSTFDSMGLGNGSTKDVKSAEVGELSIHEPPIGDSFMTKEIICSALAVIERLKRRAANVSKVGSAYRQGASCGMTANSYGGGL